MMRASQRAARLLQSSVPRESEKGGGFGTVQVCLALTCSQVGMSGLYPPKQVVCMQVCVCVYVYTHTYAFVCVVMCICVCTRVRAGVPDISVSVGRSLESYLVGLLCDS